MATGPLHGVAAKRLCGGDLLSHGVALGAHKVLVELGRAPDGLTRVVDDGIEVFILQLVVAVVCWVMVVV